MTPSILSISGQAKSYVGYTLGGGGEREGRERGEKGGRSKDKYMCVQVYTSTCFQKKTNNYFHLFTCVLFQFVGVALACTCIVQGPSCNHYRTHNQS